MCNITAVRQKDQNLVQGQEQLKVWAVLSGEENIWVCMKTAFTCLGAVIWKKD